MRFLAYCLLQYTGLIKKGEKMKNLKLSFALFLFVLSFPLNIFAQAIVADHTSVTEFGLIPDGYFDQIRLNYRFFYGHTSHGSQIITGINMLASENSTLYQKPTFNEISDDLGSNGDVSWVQPTRDFLNTHPDYNVVMWSWCGGVDSSPGSITAYLDAMNQLEGEYPNVKFVYMTGHLDGIGVMGNVYARNNQIRDYCRTHGKILFDFADIESYDPDGNYYPNDSDACNWCSTWVSTHTFTFSSGCPAMDSCAHTNCFNCYQKAKAFWWMMARLAGWPGVGSDTSPVRQNPQPSSTLNAGTISTPISMRTTRASVCRYSPTTGVAYSSMTNNFATADGLTHTAQANNLTNGSSYRYYVRCSDNASSAVNADDNFSISFSVASPDTTPPSAVANLAVSSCTSSSCILTWTARGDDGTTGRASYYDIRYSTSTINDSNWASAAQVANENSPLSATSSETFTVNGLSSATTYYFALKTGDEVPNWSALSNVASRTTGSGPDVTPPSLFNGAPSGTLDSGTTQIIISLLTDENANCKYSRDGGKNYQAFSTTGETNHSNLIQDLSDGTSYSFIVHCTDIAGNPDNKDIVIEFSIASGTDKGIYPQGLENQISVIGGCGTVNSGIGMDLYLIVVLMISILILNPLKKRRR